jgi:hypothetical protein
MPAIQTFMTGIFRTFNMPERRSARFVDRANGKNGGRQDKSVSDPEHQPWKSCRAIRIGKIR